MDKNDIYLSDFKIEQLKKELLELEKQEAEHAKESGKDMAYSFKDAAATDVSRMKYSKRIGEIRDVLKNAKALPAKIDSDEVVIGSWVKVFIDNRMQLFRIVDPVEADPSNASISYKSPLGALLMGKKAGEIIKLPSGKDVRIEKVD